MLGNKFVWFGVRALGTSVELSRTEIFHDHMHAYSVSTCNAKGIWIDATFVSLHDAFTETPCADQRRVEGALHLIQRPEKMKWVVPNGTNWGKAERALDIGVFTLGDACSSFRLTSQIPPLSSTSNFDADVKKNVGTSPNVKTAFPSSASIDFLLNAGVHSGSTPCS